MHRSILQELVENGEFYRFRRGLYVLGYSDRTPAQYTMTFPKGYNSPSLKQENINIKRVVPENYSFGVIELQSPCGNPIRVYDLERMLCDILRGSMRISFSRGRKRAIEKTVSPAGSENENYKKVDKMGFIESPVNIV